MARCSGVPNVAMVGPTSPQVTLISSVDWGGSKACSSSVNANTCRMDNPAPPSSEGSAIAPYPASYRCLRYARTRSRRERSPSSVMFWNTA